MIRDFENQPQFHGFLSNLSKFQANTFNISHHKTYKRYLASTLIYTLFRTIIFSKTNFLAFQSFNEGILCLLGENWEESWKLDMIIFIITIFWLGSFLIGVIKPQSCFPSRIVYCCYSVMTIISPIVVSYLIKTLRIIIFNESLQSSQDVFEGLKVLVSIGIIGSLILIMHLLFYDLRVCRKISICWKTCNRINLFKFLLDSARVILLTVSHTDIILIVISLFLELLIKSKENQEHSHLFYGELNPKAYAIEEISTNYTIGVHLVIIVNFITNEKQSGTILLFIWIIFIVIKCLLEFISAHKTVSTIPPCQQSHLVTLYNFYFEFLDKNKKPNDIQSQIYQLLKIHAFSCTEDGCVFNDSFQSEQQIISHQNLIKDITATLQKYQFSSPRNEILFELWKHEVNLNSTIEKQGRQFLPENSYIISNIIINSSLQKLSDFNNQELSRESAELLSINFFKSVENILEGIKTFNLQLMKLKPSLSKLIDKLCQIMSLYKQLQASFQILYRKKQLDFRVIMAYKQINEKFFENSKIQMKFQSRINNLKFSKDSMTLRQSNRPCLYVNAETGKIESFNQEVLKTLRMKKIQLKDKDFINLYEPKIPVKDLFKQKNSTGEKHKFLLFFKIPFLQGRSMYLEISYQIVSNKPIYIIKLQPKVFNPNTFDILVNVANHSLLVAEKKKVTFSKNKQAQICISSSLFYFNFLKNVIAEMIEEKVDHRYISKIFSQFSCSIVRKYSYSQDIVAFEIRLLEKNYEEFENINSLNFSSSNFAFTYNEVGQSLLLNGRFAENSHLINNQIARNFYNRKRKSSIAMLQFKTDNHLCKQIKTYRLFQQQLYNVDLQDKQAYERDFDQIQPFINDPTYREKVSPYTLIIYSIILASFLVILSFYSLFKKDQELDICFDLTSSLENISLFKIEFTVINGILRDVGNGLYDKLGLDYRGDLNEALAGLQRYKQAIPFKKDAVYECYYQDNKIKGNLNELLQYALFNIYRFLTSDLELQILENHHNFVNEHLDTLMAKEQSQIKAKLMNVREGFKESMQVRVIICSILGLVISGLIAQSWYAYRMRLGKLLQFFLMLSQKEMKRLADEAAKLKQFIFNKQKYENVQAFEEREISKKQKYRRKPKQVQYGQKARVLQITLASALGAIILLTSLVYYEDTETIIMKIEKKFAQSSDLINLYSCLSALSYKFEVTGYYNQSLVDQLNKKIQIIEFNPENYQFSDQLKSDIGILAFGNSCEYLESKEFLKSQENCSNTQPNFIIYNPFELGLDMYFRSQIYHLKNDLFQTFAFSGVYSRIYRSVFLDLGKRMKKEIITFIKESKLEIQLLNWAFVTIMIVEILIILAVMVYFQKKIGETQEIRIILNLQQQKPLTNTNQILLNSNEDSHQKINPWSQGLEKWQTQF